ncbi:MAG TPA: CHAT domain-containing protein, partial [Ktedonobacteraceae bacterium]
MEQAALLTILRTESAYRFRLELPDGSPLADQEFSIDLTSEIRERLRRALQASAQYMQTMALADVKRQTTKLSAANDSLLTLGRYLFDNILPTPIQEALRRLDTALIINTDTPDIPWELLFDGNAKAGRFLCQHLSIGRQMTTSDEGAHRPLVAERPARKMGRRETQGLIVLFLVNPGGDRPVAEEEVATLCTTLPESVSRIILYRQQVNQLEMKMRISADSPHVVHYAGPLPITTSEEPVLALCGNSRLDSSAVEQLLRPLARRPLIFLSYHEDERSGRNGSAVPAQKDREEGMETLAQNLLASGAGAVLAMRWPVNTKRAREFAALLYQEVADGVSLGEAVRRARA